MLRLLCFVYVITTLLQRLVHCVWLSVICCTCMSNYTRITLRSSKGPDCSRGPSPGLVIAALRSHRPCCARSGRDPCPPRSAHPCVLLRCSVTILGVAGWAVSHSSVFIVSPRLPPALRDALFPVPAAAGGSVATPRRFLVSHRVHLHPPRPSVDRDYAIDGAGGGRPFSGSGGRLLPGCRGGRR